MMKHNRVNALQKAEEKTEMTQSRLHTSHFDYLGKNSAQIGTNINIFVWFLQQMFYWMHVFKYDEAKTLMSLPRTQSLCIW